MRILGLKRQNYLVYGNAICPRACGDSQARKFEMHMLLQDLPPNAPHGRDIARK